MRKLSLWRGRIQADSQYLSLSFRQFCILHFVLLYFCILYFPCLSFSFLDLFVFVILYFRNDDETWLVVRVDPRQTVNNGMIWNNTDIDDAEPSQSIDFGDWDIFFNLVSEFGNRAKIEFNAVWLDCKIYAFKRQFLFMKGKLLCL